MKKIEEQKKQEELDKYNRKSIEVITAERLIKGSDNADFDYNRKLNF